MKPSVARSKRAPRHAARRAHALYPFAAGTPVLIVPGLNDSDPDHWQSRWQQRYPDFQRVHQADFATPALATWSATVAAAIHATSAPPIVVAHSFGCLATVHAIAERRSVVAGALLVAPADPDRFGVASMLPRDPLPVPTTLVGSTNDPWLKLVKAGALASRWGSHFVGYENAGHINAESGHGDWTAGLALLRDLAERAASTGMVAHAVHAAA
jgi:predicted alpha/beta hydrolase family esterase